MPKFEVDSDRTSEVSDSLAADFAEFQDRLGQIKSRIDGLIADGYRTPAAETQFSPFFEEFHAGFESINEGLDGGREVRVTVWIWKYALVLCVYT